MTRPATDTTTRLELRSTEIGCSGPGLLIGFACAWAFCSIAITCLSSCVGSGCRLPAIDGEHLTGREGRFVGCEEDDCVGDLVRRADTLERNTCHKAGL